MLYIICKIVCIVVILAALAVVCYTGRDTARRQEARRQQHEKEKRHNE